MCTLKSYKMFSDNLIKQLKTLNIDPKASVYEIRTTLEDLLDNTAHLINTKDHHQYSTAERAYSDFMEEYNNILDIGDSVFK